MKRTSLILLLIFVVCALYASPLKVACVGNSVTYGAGLTDREHECYPTRLQQLLGENYLVKNFGKNGATLLKRGHRPYIDQQEYKDALAFAADLVVIHLGLNDTDPRNWPYYQEDFVKDYLALIESFKEANPKCRVLICRMSPIANRHGRFKSGTRQYYEEIQQEIECVATYAGVQLVDFQKPLYDRPDLLPDAIHPNAEGAAILAATVYSEITGDFGGLQLPILYTDGMVLQRDKPLTLTGLANAGQKVKVSIGKQRHQTVTGTNGKWKLTVDAMKVGGPYLLVVETEDRKVQINDVLIGEVWLCSGQSNMAFSLATDGNFNDSLVQANDRIRFFDMRTGRATRGSEWRVTALDSLNKHFYYEPAKWKNCTPQTSKWFSAVAYYFGQALSDSLNVPIGLIHNAIGGSNEESWIDRASLEAAYPDMFTNWTKNDFINNWCRITGEKNTKRAVTPLQRHPFEPCYLYETGIQPLQAYPIRGVIWYQGESNDHNIALHESLFSLLINSWRKNWNEEFPFYYVQLSSLNRPAWPRFRDSQRRLMAAIPHTGMVVCSDVGDSLDVHPIWKKPVGERLARWALSHTYGRDVTPSGPLYQSVIFKKGAAYLSFDHAKGLKSADGRALRTFEVAEKEGLFYPAQAEIIGQEVRVQSKEVKNPHFVRYGWQPFTRANLVNSEGLPASTFRTGGVKPSTDNKL